MIRVFVADDHRIVREGIRRLLDDTDDIRVVGEATSGAALLDGLAATAADVVLLDVSMPRTSFAEILRELRGRHPSIRAVVLSAYAEHEYAVRALKGGAFGYVTKERSPEELAEAIRAVAAGRRHISATVGDLLAEDVAGDRTAHAALSDREDQVLRLLGAGLSVKEAGARLGLSIKTVSTYRSRLLEKLRLRTTAELIRYAVDHHLR